MKFATVLPPSLVELLGDRVGDYHLVLADYVLKDQAYADHYLHRKFDYGDYVIMDNGAAEGERLSFEQLEYACRRLEPSELVIPDALNEAGQTVTLAFHFCNEPWVERARRNGLKVMAVPQGKSWAEWRDCCEHLLALAPDCIGISKFDADYMPRSGTRGRLAAVHYIYEAPKAMYQPEMHLLGLFGNPIELGVIQAITGNAVRGADSVLPIAAAYYGEEFSPVFGTVARSEAWDFKEVTGLSAIGLEAARRNIELCQVWAERGFNAARL